LSPQIYVFILREGNLIEKIFTKNFLLKLIFILTIVMIALIVFVSPLNLIFITTPIYDWKLWIIIIGLSVITSLIRLISGKTIFGFMRK
jgi:hypothetical protein